MTIGEAPSPMGKTSLPTVSPITYRENLITYGKVPSPRGYVTVAVKHLNVSHLRWIFLRKPILPINLALHFHLFNSVQ